MVDWLRKLFNLAPTCECGYVMPDGPAEKLYATSAGTEVTPGYSCPKCGRMWMGRYSKLT